MAHVWERWSGLTSVIRGSQAPEEPAVPPDAEATSVVFYKIDGNRYQNIDFDQFREALKRAGIDDGFHFHDLRHTAATWSCPRSISLL